MKAEHWMDAMGQIDMDLVEEAEQRVSHHPVRRPPRKLLALGRLPSGGSPTLPVGGLCSWGV